MFSLKLMVILVVVGFLIFSFVRYWSNKNEYFIQIAHAGGLYENKLCTNSLKAIKFNAKEGFKYFEIDIFYKNGIHVTHDEKRRKSSNPKFSDLIKLTRDLKIKIILDIKNEYSKSLKEIAGEIKKYGSFGYFIPQVYQIEDIEEVSKYPFKQVLISNWKIQPSFGQLDEMIDYAKLEDIEIFGTSLWSKFNHRYPDYAKYYPYYKNKGIQIFIHGDINSDEAIEYAQKNLFGIFSQTVFF